MKNQEIKTKNVEIILNSGLMVTGELIHLDKIAKDDKPLTLNAITVKQNVPLYAKFYKSNAFVLSEDKTRQGSPIPTYVSSDFGTILKRAFTIATIFPSTIRSLKYI